jgi:uncharacterized protein YggU (UPF0235/DUF167 family)
VKLRIKAVPGSSRDCLAGWLGDTLKVRVTAAPEGGKANAAIEAIVAEGLGLPRRSVRIVAGKTSSRKIVEVTGLSEAEIHRRIASPPCAPRQRG